MNFLVRAYESSPYIIMGVIVYIFGALITYILTMAEDGSDNVPNILFLQIFVTMMWPIVWASALIFALVDFMFEIISGGDEL